MRVTKVFMVGNSQAVRLPKDLRFDVDEVEILRRGDEIVLRPLRRNLEAVFDLLARLPIDDLERRDDPPAQLRDGL